MLVTVDNAAVGRGVEYVSNPPSEQRSDYMVSLSYCSSCKLLPELNLEW
jgi:hypothetical protein